MLFCDIEREDTDFGAWFTWFSILFCWFISFYYCKYFMERSTFLLRFSFRYNFFLIRILLNCPFRSLWSKIFSIHNIMNVTIFFKNFNNFLFFSSISIYSLPFRQILYANWNCVYFNFVRFIYISTNRW